MVRISSQGGRRVNKTRARVTGVDFRSQLQISAEESRGARGGETNHARKQWVSEDKVTNGLSQVRERD
jgi:hypothetical protein